MEEGDCKPNFFFFFLQRMWKGRWERVKNAACLVLKLWMSPQEALRESSVLHLQAQLVFYLHSFLFFAPKVDTSHLVGRRGKAGRASAVTRTHPSGRVTPGVAPLPLACDTSTRDRALRLSLGLCCSGDSTQTHMFKLFYMRKS